MTVSELMLVSLDNGILDAQERDCECIYEYVGIAASQVGRQRRGTRPRTKSESSG